MAYAVPNVSEGRDADTIRALVDACRVPRVRVLDVHSDPDHHRSVITLAGEPVAVQDALVDLAGECIDRIDLRRHRGAHPRIGALDVAPIVAFEDEDVPLAAEVARGLAGRLGTELNLPVFLYGAVATDPERTRPRDFRRGGLEELERAIDEGELVPDAGPATACTRAPAPCSWACARRSSRSTSGCPRAPSPTPGPSRPACASRAGACRACARSGSTCPRPGWRRCR